MKFPEERYELIEKLVQMYQQGDKENAGGQLVALFEPLFNKYIKIIRKGIIDFNDYESRHFLSLFIADPKVRLNLKRKYQSKKTREIAYRTLTLINNAYIQIFDEDLYQELVLSFLNFVSKYKVDKSFCAYLGSTFPYEVSQIVKKVLKNPISTAYISDFSDEILDLFGKAVEDSIDLDDRFPSNDVEELSNNWIYGLTCSEAFETLTPFERLILKMFYLDKISDTSIGNKVGYHRNSIRTKRKAAVEKVRERTLELRIVTDGPKKD
jgi:RNA polymerase sigma factor (sigma-70 family)